MRLPLASTNASGLLATLLFRITSPDQRALERLTQLGAFAPATDLSFTPFSQAAMVSKLQSILSGPFKQNALLPDTGGDDCAAAALIERARMVPTMARRMLYSP